MIPENEDALRRAHPAFLEALQKTPPMKDAELVPSRRGPVTLVWTDTAGRRRFLHSQVDPIGESRKVVDAVVGSSSRVLLVGHGVGHEIREMAGRVQDLTVLAVNLPMLRFLCDHLNLSDLFSNPTVRWIFGSPAVVRSKLQDIQPSGVTVVLHPPFLELIPPEFEGLLQIVRRIQSGRDTEDRIGPDARENLRRNFPALASPGVTCLFGSARGRPVVVAGAGPTLDESIDAIRRLVPRACLIAVDTVAQGLAEEGLEPDLIVSIDPKPESGLHFLTGDGVASLRGILVFTPITHPDLVASFEGRRLVAIPKNHFLLHPAESVLASKGLLVSGGSVSILAASLAVVMEPAFVCLAGVDFRASAGRFYSGLSSYLRRARQSAGRFSSSETAEHEILFQETRQTPEGTTTPRLDHYASDFRYLLKQSLVPFYSLGPAPVDGVRSGILPCVDVGPMSRPIHIPGADGQPPQDLFSLLGMKL